MLEFAENRHPIFRATTPLSRGNLKSRGRGKLSIHNCADQKTIETIFRIIAFGNQLSLYGAAANMCEEFEFHQDRSGQPDILMGQSIVLGEIRQRFLLQNENPSHHQIPWQQYEERIKSLSLQRVYLLIQKIGYGNSTTKTTTMTRAMRTNMRPTTA